MGIDELFGPAGALSRAGLPRREGQAAMAAAVARAFAREEHLVVEAPTGTGKSLAYLLPAALAAGGRTIVATANIALQEQLAGKDLPFVASLLPHPPTFGLLKGLSNYLCRRQLARQQASPRASATDAHLRAAVNGWAQLTKTGDKSELPFEPTQSLWGDFSVSANECGSGDCPYVGDCFANGAQAAAQSSQIVVTNYHMLFLLGRFGKLPFERVIMDEAHRAADIARECYGFEVGLGVLRRFAATVARVGLDGAVEVREAAENFFARARDLYYSNAYSIRLREPHQLLADRLVRALAVVAQQTARADVSRGKAVAQAGYLMYVLTEADELRSDRVVYFLDEWGGVHGLPERVDRYLREDIFEGRSCVLTSATLASGPGDFGFLLDSVGLPDRTRTLQVPSPFNWAANAALVLPADAVDPAACREEFGPYVARSVVEVVEQARGRTLALFTSKEKMELAYTALQEAHLPFTLLKQGDLPRMKLVERFKEDANSVLLGVDSFWAGVDVPGEALSCVVVDRLPFPNFTDPIADAIRGRGEDWFLEYALPRAVIQFRQGVGRLLRTASDRGVVVVLDGRVSTKMYGESFLLDLAGVPRFERIDIVRTFLDCTAEEWSAALATAG